MKVIPTFPTDLFEFHNTEIDNKQLIPELEKYAETVKSGETISSMRNLHDKEELQPLFSWINKCIEEVRIYQKYDMNSLKADKYFTTTVDELIIWQIYLSLITFV